MWRFVRMLATGLGTLALLSQAQADTCPVEQASKNQLGARLSRMEHYFRNPHSPKTFRALAGFGDPQVEPAPTTTFYSAFHTWGHEDFSKLRVKLMPEAGYGHSCRITAPVETLRERIGRLGDEHAYVKQWIAVERAVLSACSAPHGKSVRPELPKPLVTRDAAVLRLQTQDRAYQQAALQFYEGKTEAALKQFRRIAADKASPNRPNAAYMVAPIESGTNPKRYGERKPLVSSKRSLERIDAILADPSLKSVHIEAAELISWLGAVSPDDVVLARARVREILTSLEAPLERIKSDAVARARYARALGDVVLLQRHYADYPADWWLTGAVPNEKTTSKAMAEAADSDEMARWIVFPDNSYVAMPWLIVGGFPWPWDNKEARSMSISHKEAFGPQNPWRHLAEETSRERLKEEIARVEACDDDVAIASLGFDYYMTVREGFVGPAGHDRAQNFVEALEIMKDFPFKGTFVHNAVLHDSLQYLINGGYLQMARRVRDEARPHPDGHYGALRPLLIVLAEDEDHLVAALKGELYSPPEFLNHLSIDALWGLAARDELGRGLRAVLARTAWARTYALGRTINGSNDRLMRMLNPEMTVNWRSPVGRSVRSDDRRVLADVLKSPALNVVMKPWARMPRRPSDDGRFIQLDHHDRNDNNWWCAWEPDRNALDLDNALRLAFGATRNGRFERNDYSLDVRSSGYASSGLYMDRGSLRQLLHAALRQSYVFRHMDRDELEALSEIDCAPKTLSLRVIDWINHPGLFGTRDGQAEALANAVVTTRWGCMRQGSHAEYSRTAYQLLHDKFPESDAAKRTRYWFACPLTDDGKCRQSDPLGEPAIR